MGLRRLTEEWKEGWSSGRCLVRFSLKMSARGRGQDGWQQSPGSRTQEEPEGLPTRTQEASGLSWHNKKEKPQDPNKGQLKGLSSCFLP